MSERQWWAIALIFALSGTFWIGYDLHLLSYILGVFSSIAATWLTGFVPPWYRIERPVPHD